MANLDISNRQLSLLILLQEKDYITSDKLADNLRVSIRTIKKEISALRKIINTNYIVIDSKPGHGYRLKIFESDYYEKVTKHIKRNDLVKFQNFSKDSFNRIIYIIRKLLVEDNFIKLDDLAEDLFVSRTTIESDFTEVRYLFGKFNIKVISKPNYGIKISGDEFDLRRCISEYYFNIPIEITTQWFDKENNIIEKIESILVDRSDANNIRLSEFSIKNIAIHIYISIIRSGEGLEFKITNNNLSKDLSNGSIITSKEIFQDLSKEITLSISEQEVLYLALHLDSKQIIENPSKNLADDQLIINKVIEEIQRNFNVDFSRDNMLNKFLIQHIPQMIKRIKRGLLIRNPLLQENLRKYLFALKITESAIYILEKEYDVQIPLEEFGYLMLYFQNALNKIKKNRKIKIAFIMGRGRSDTIVYQQEIKMKLSPTDFEIISFQSWREIQNSNVKIDIVVSVYPLLDSDFKYMVNIDNGDYIDQIKQFAHEIQINEVKIEKYFKPEFFISNLKGKNKNEVYANILEVLKTEAIITEEIKFDKPLVSKEVGNEIVHLQDLYKICRHPVGFIGILEEPIIWDKAIVKVIFLIKTKRDGDKDLPIICQLFSDFISDSSKIINLKNEKEFEKFKKNLIIG